jgi:hypothetical protein
MRTLPALAVLLASTSLLGAALLRYPEAPPLAHTGGFREPTCHACHFGVDPDPPGGALRIEGLPPLVTAGTTRRVTVVLEDETMRVAGFQLAARFSDGRQAGSFGRLDDGVAAHADGSPAVIYVHHTGAGIALSSAGGRHWSFDWTAPAEAGEVVFHAAGNAGDGDGSPFGDHVRTAELRVGVVAEK